MSILTTGSAPRIEGTTIFAQSDDEDRSRFYEMLKSGASYPEKLLALAIIEDSVHILRNRQRLAQYKSNKFLFTETFRWLMRNDQDEYIFSFRSICQLLEMNPDYIRSGILSMLDRCRAHPRHSDHKVILETANRARPSAVMDTAIKSSVRKSSTASRSASGAAARHRLKETTSSRSERAAPIRLKTA